MGNLGISRQRNANEGMKLGINFIIGAIFGFLIGLSFSFSSLSKIGMPSSIFSYASNKNKGMNFHEWTDTGNHNKKNLSHCINQSLESHGLAKSIGVERLPPGIIVAESDLFLRRLWGEPSEDLSKKPKYLLTLTVGFEQRYNIDAIINKFSENFTILLFHYDGRVTEWDEFEWATKAIHINARKQTKWWFAKRFLHPDIVASYEYIFIWDEDLGVENFDAEEYVRLVKKHKLEISQPALEPYNGLTYKITERIPDGEVHRFVEIMATVFSRDAWRCAWHMLQNDLVHGWGIDFAFGKCLDSPHEEIGVVDSQWIVHQGIPSLGNQGVEEKGKAPWMGVRERCHREWAIFQERMEAALVAYNENMTLT